MHRNDQRGFTLPELLVTVLFLSGFVVLSAFLLHTTSHTTDRNNARRWSDIAQITQGLNRYVAAHGSLPASVPATSDTIGTGKVDLCKALLPTYLKEMPLDPSVGVDLSQNNCDDSNALYSTGYNIGKNGDGSVTVSAPHAESGQKISITHKY